MPSFLRNLSKTPVLGELGRPDLVRVVMAVPATENELYVLHMGARLLRIVSDSNRRRPWLVSARHVRRSHAAPTKGAEHRAQGAERWAESPSLGLAAPVQTASGCSKQPGPHSVDASSHLPARARRSNHCSTIGPPAPAAQAVWLGCRSDRPGPSDSGQTQGWS